MTEIKELIPTKEIVDWYRYLHQNPELSFEENETSKYIYNELSKMPNLELTSPIKNSVVATLKGKGKGKTIALRADIDALPVMEESNLEFKSKNPGVMHACGHDTHTAMLLGACKVLSEMKDEINGTIKFIFQPAEEKPPGGAKAIVEAGVLENVDLIFGLHIAPTIPAGAIGIKNGPLTSASDVFNITIQGKGSHGSMPEAAIDPILVGVQIINNLNSIVSRNISPLDNAVISIGAFNSGSTNNVIPDTATIKGTVRTTDPETRKFIKSRIEEIVKNITNIYNASYDLDYRLGYSSVVNDEEATKVVRAAALKVVGKEGIIEAEQIMGSEDFSAYTDVKSGAFFILGGGSAKDGYEFVNHHPKFKIDEKSLPVGTMMHIQIVLDLLNK